MDSAPLGHAGIDCVTLDDDHHGRGSGDPPVSLSPRGWDRAQHGTIGSSPTSWRRPDLMASRAGTMAADSA